MSYSMVAILASQHGLKQLLYSTCLTSGRRGQSLPQIGMPMINH